MTYPIVGQAFENYPTDVVGLLFDLMDAKGELNRGQNGAITGSN